MSYVFDALEPGEQILCEASTRGVAYVAASVWLLLLMMPGRLIGLLTGELALTDKRVLGKVGLFRRRLLAVRHAQVEIVRVQQGLLGKLFDYGSVTVSTNTDRRITLRGIASPREIQREIDEAVEVAILGRKLSEVGDSTAAPAAVAAKPAPAAAVISPPPALPEPPKPSSTATPRIKPDPTVW